MTTDSRPTSDLIESPLAHHHFVGATADPSPSAKAKASSQAIQPSSKNAPGTWRRGALVGVVLLSDLCFTGLVFGWAPLLLMLKEENQYAELCEHGETHCHKQENQLNLMFALASVAANAFALPIGVFLDKCGAKVTIGFAAVIELTGLLLLAFSDSRGMDMFLPGYILLAFGGSLTMMSSFPASFLIIKYQTAILAAISCLFDGSSVVFLILYSIHSSFGVSRKTLFMSYAAFGLLIYIALVVLWHLNEDDLSDQRHEPVEDEKKPLLAPKDSSQKTPSDNVNDHAQTILTEFYQQYGSLSDQELANQSDDAEPTEFLHKCESFLLEPELSSLSAGKQIKTFEFVYLLIFASIQVLRCTLYIGSTNQLLENYGDAQRNFFFTKLFSIILPLGFIFVPAIDRIVERRGLSSSLKFTNFMGLLYNGLALIPILWVQSMSFFLFTGFRAFLYAIMSAFAAKTFGLRNLGTLIGTTFTIASLVGLAEYPVMYFSNETFGGNLTIMLFLSLVLCIALLPLTGYQERRDQERTARRQSMLAKHGLRHVVVNMYSPTAIFRGRTPSFRSPKPSTTPKFSSKV